MTTANGNVKQTAKVLQFSRKAEAVTSNRKVVAPALKMAA